MLLKVLGIQALAPLELLLKLGVWLALSVLASQPSMLTNCSLVLSLWQDFNYKWVEDVNLLDVKLVLGLIVEAFSQLGSLSTKMILGLETGKTI